MGVGDQRTYQEGPLQVYCEVHLDIGLSLTIPYCSLQYSYMGTTVLVVAMVAGFKVDFMRLLVAVPIWHIYVFSTPT